MRIIESVSELRNFVSDQKNDGKTIGLVPTMGYLHDGHKSLIETSAKHNDVTIVSIFVNPTQFGVGEDLETYPRDLEHDCVVAQGGGASVIFHPTPEEMYPNGYQTYVSVEDITKILCGKSRPMHFRGVTTVCAKLFNISRADNAYFGQKDAQQLAVILRMIDDLNMNIEIVPCPIVREPDGLAMSSRNTYLSPEERKQAPVLSRSLFEAEKMFRDGIRDIRKIKKKIQEIITSSDIAEIEYIEAVSFPNLIPVDTIDGKTLIALAVKFGKTRLIDNIIL